MAHTANLNAGKKILEIMKANLYSEKAFNRDFIPPIGGFSGSGTVKVRVWGSTTASDYNSDTGLAPTPGVSTIVDVAINKDKGVNEIMDEADVSAFTENMDDRTLALYMIATEGAGFGLAESLESDGMAVLATEGTITDDVVFTKDTVFDGFLAAEAQLDAAKMPRDGRVAYVSSATKGFLVKSPDFVKAGALSEEMLHSGYIGMCNGFEVFTNQYLPANVEMIACQPKASVRIFGIVIEPKIVALYNEFIGASAVQGRYKFGHKVMRPLGVYVKTDVAK